MDNSFGGLLGGQDNSFSGGLLGDGMNDPRTISNLSAAAALLQAGGASRMPVTTGDALGRGLQAGLGGYKAGQDMNIERQKAQLLQTQVAMAMMQAKQRQTMLDAIMPGLLGGDQQTTPQPQGGLLSDQRPIQSAPGPAPSGNLFAGASQALGGNGLSGQPPQPSTATVPQQPQQQGLGQGGAFGGVGKLPAMLTMSGDPGMMKLGEMLQSANTSEVTKALDLLRIDRNSPEGQSYQRQALEKSVNIPPVSVRPGAGLYDTQKGMPITNSFSPKLPDGTMPTRDAQGNITGVSMLPGAPQAIQQEAAAESAGKNTSEPVQVWNSQTNQPIFTNKTAAAGGNQQQNLFPSLVQAESGGNQNALSPKGAIGTTQLMPGTAKDLGVNPNDKLENVAGGLSYLGKMRQKYGNDATALIAYNMGPGATDEWLKGGADPNKLPTETKNYVQQVLIQAGRQQQQPGAGIAAGPALGVPQGIEAQQKELSTNWQKLHDQNEQAQVTTSYLQNIQQQASKAATGPMSDKIQYVNSLLSLVGNEKATNASGSRLVGDERDNGK